VTLDEPRFERELRQHGPMGIASRAYCRFVASQLRQITGRPLYSPRPHSSPPWLPCRARVWSRSAELAGRPACRNRRTAHPAARAWRSRSRPQANSSTRSTISTAYFNFFPNEFTNSCGRQINVDAGDLRLDPRAIHSGCRRTLCCWRPTTDCFRQTQQPSGMPWASTCCAILRKIPVQSCCAAQPWNMLRDRAGRDKGYAANFAKLIKGYVELRHFSADSFFNGPGLEDQLERIPLAFELWPSQSEI